MQLARNPELGVAVEEFSGLRRRVIKKRSRGHGHIVFYRVTGTQLEVVHVYHTAQDWQSGFLQD